MKRYLRHYWGLRRINLGMAIGSLLFVGIGAACTGTSDTFPAGTETAFKEGVLADDPSVDSATLDCMWEWVEDNLSMDDVKGWMDDHTTDAEIKDAWQLLEACPSLWQYAR